MYDLLVLIVLSFSQYYKNMGPLNESHPRIFQAITLPLFGFLGRFVKD